MKVEWFGSKTPEGLLLGILNMRWGWSAAGRKTVPHMGPSRNDNLGWDANTFRTMPLKTEKMCPWEQ
eukprot:3436270-Amphidinium_carterae.1